MKKRKMSKFAAGMTAGFLIGSAAFLPGCNRQENVYGPPPEADVTAEPTYAPETNIPEPVYGPPTEEEISVTPVYEPEENIPVAVYGPPEDLNEPAEYDPENNIPEDVYGPPEWFDSEEADEIAEETRQPAKSGEKTNK